jgi:hypothetical protein
MAPAPGCAPSHQYEQNVIRNTLQQRDQRLAGPPPHAAPLGINERVREGVDMLVHVHKAPELDNVAWLAAAGMQVRWRD